METFLFILACFWILLGVLTFLIIVSDFLEIPLKELILTVLSILIFSSLLGLSVSYFLFYLNKHVIS